MKNCSCGKKPEHADNSDIHPEYQAKHHTVRHQIKCECGIQTSFYSTLDQAECAWELKGWVNRRRAA